MVLPARYLGDLELIFPEKHHLQRLGFVTSIPDSFVQGCFSVECASPSENSAIFGQYHRMKEGASDLDNVKAFKVPCHARKLVLYVQNVVVKSKFLVLIVPRRVNSTQLCHTR